jgi:hypothetical protein
VKAASSEWLRWVESLAWGLLWGIGLGSIPGKGVEYGLVFGILAFLLWAFFVWPLRRRRQAGKPSGA